MAFNLSPPQSRALAIALLLVLCGAIVRGVALPLWDTYTRNEREIEQQRDHIFRFTRVAASLDGLERRVADVERARAGNHQTLPESSPTFAAAALQERVKSIVTDSGGKLTSTQVLPAVTEGAFTRVTIAVRMSVSNPVLQRALYDLEAGVPYLFVDKLMVIARRIRRPRVFRRRGVPVSPPPPATQSLDVRFNLSGYLRAAAAETTARS